MTECSGANATATPTEKAERKPEVVVITHIVTPYHTELFNAVSSHGAIDLRVVYLLASAPHRQWQRRKLDHPNIELAAAGSPQEQQASAWTGAADLVVFGFYQHPFALRWLENRFRAGKPMCFWGERPGFRVRGLVGEIYRLRTLGSFMSPQAPIWGIGQWGIDGYKREFGTSRPYFNVPYVSDLARFRTDRSEARRGDGTRRVLFSGSLIKRKGVDLLAKAFRRLAQLDDCIALDFVGDGVLRNQLMRALQPVSDRVMFHGFQQWDRLPAYYAQADILCVPSRYDGWGLVVPEGLAAGLPVIATDKMGAAVDFLRDGVNGWSVAAGDYDALHAALSKTFALSDGELNRMSAAAVESVAKHTVSDGVHRFEQAALSTLAGWRGS
jgi:glycosyltransferase involved in cell wall biosynthesis